MDGAVQSVAEAYPAPESDEPEENDEEEQNSVPERPIANDATPEDVPETPTQYVPEAPIQYVPQVPTRYVPNKNKKTQVQIHHDEEDEDDDEIPVRSRKNESKGAVYFPVHFGSTNGGAIAIANSYSTGKGE